MFAIRNVITCLLLTASLFACRQADSPTFGMYWVYADADGNHVTDIARADDLHGDVKYYSNKLGEGLFVHERLIFDEACLSKAKFAKHPASGKPVLIFKIQPKCSARYGKYIAQYIGKTMAIVVNDTLVSSYRIKGHFAYGGYIEGDMSDPDLKSLAKAY